MRAWYCHPHDATQYNIPVEVAFTGDVNGQGFSVIYGKRLAATVSVEGCGVLAVPSRLVFLEEQ